MQKFILFNPRLTDQLNDIFHYGLTVVSGGAGVGKSFAVSSFLSTLRVDVTWHASYSEDIRDFLYEFKTCMQIKGEHADVTEAADSPASSVVLPIEFSLQIKNQVAGTRKVYVLDYQLDELPTEHMRFLSNLANQRITGFYIVIICRNFKQNIEKKKLLSGINWISETYFLLRPDEFKRGFSRYGVNISSDEAEYLYLMSAGYMPMVSTIFHEINNTGKKAVYTYYDPGRDNDEKMELSTINEEEWSERFVLQEQFWEQPAFHDIQSKIASMELTKALIALEAEQLKAKLYSLEWDLCVCYKYIISVLEGSARDLFNKLEEDFNKRISLGNYQSAFRILLIRIEIRIMMGKQWMDTEEELIDFFILKSLYKKRYISPITLQSHFCKKRITENWWPF